MSRVRILSFSKLKIAILNNATNGLTVARQPENPGNGCPQTLLTCLQNKITAFGIIALPLYFRKKSDLRFTRNSLGKLEDLLASCGYLVRYEKGNFASSSCRLHENKVIVVNKFLNVEQRNLVLIDFFFDKGLEEFSWTAKQKKWVNQLLEWRQKKLQFED